MLKGDYHYAKTAKFNVIDVGKAPTTTAPAAKKAAAPGAKGAPAAAPAAAVEKKKTKEEGTEKKAEETTFALVSAAVTKQASVVKQLKKEGKTTEVEAAEKELKRLRCELAKLGPAETLDLNRKVFDETLLRRMFVVPAFEIHGGTSGLFDFGPPGAALKANIVDCWRRHFILEEKMLEMECTCLTPEPVLKTSGHVDRFTDLMVKDVVTGECYRADKLLEDVIDEYLEKNPKETPDEHRLLQRQADALTPEELDSALKKYQTKAPATGNELTNSFAFNLMFKTQIGPSGDKTGYLRPETAQGLFVNFKRLLDYNNSRVPFAAAQIGLGFRNEIAPKNGLLRVREFTMAEIEHFVHPEEKQHPKFASIADVMLVLFDRTAQMGSGLTTASTVADAVSEKIIDNETLGYFMARTQLFAVKIGMAPDKLRFRQHLTTEMAHYAADCWDLEILTAYGWVECVGHADRACYDLDVHAKSTGTSNEAQRLLNEPKFVQALEVEPNRKLIGTTFKAQQKKVHELLEAADQAQLQQWASDLERTSSSFTTIKVGDFELTKEMVSIKKTSKKVEVEKFVPSVVEPSFGVGRLVHALLEHSFSQREEDEQRVVMRLRPNVAPIKCVILNLQSNPAFPPFVAKLESLLTTASIAHKSDTSGQSVGKRYARADELGVPFGVTVDFKTLDSDTVTLRDRDSMAQVRVPIADVPSLLNTLCGRHAGETPVPWLDAVRAYPAENASSSSQSSVLLEHTPRAVFSRPANLVRPASN